MRMDWPLSTPILSWTALIPQCNRIRRRRKIGRKSNGDGGELATITCPIGMWGAKGREKQTAQLRHLAKVHGSKRKVIIYTGWVLYPVNRNSDSPLGQGAKRVVRHGDGGSSTHTVGVSLSYSTTFTCNSDILPSVIRTGVGVIAWPSSGVRGYRQATILHYPDLLFRSV